MIVPHLLDVPSKNEGLETGPVNRAAFLTVLERSIWLAVERGEAGKMLGCKSSGDTEQVGIDPCRHLKRLNVNSLLTH